ncbi:hypothetical protein B0H14DRAFT_2567957 [Mycena olivaceomarginata]|nr:hypothetical protein B0H14DRAFT_2567957 [Mycena olivaceomarginata]
MAAAMRLASISQLCSTIHLPFWDVAWGAAINILMAYCCDGMGLPARVGSHPAAVHQSRQLWSPRLQPGAAHRRFPWPRARVPPAAAAARPPAQCVVWRAFPPRSINPASSGRLGYSRAPPTAAFPGPRARVPPATAAARPPAQCGLVPLDGMTAAAWLARGGGLCYMEIARGA